MSSMEELNDLDRTTNSEKWGIDRKIPVAIIIVVIFQTIAITWGAATLSNDVKNYGEKIVKLENNYDKFVEKADNKFETQAQHTIDKTNSRREMDSIKAELEKLEARLLDLERTVN